MKKNPLSVAIAFPRNRRLRERTATGSRGINRTYVRKRKAKGERRKQVDACVRERRQREAHGGRWSRRMEKDKDRVIVSSSSRVYINCCVDYKEDDGRRRASTQPAAVATAASAAERSNYLR